MEKGVPEACVLEAEDVLAETNDLGEPGRDFDLDGLVVNALAVINEEVDDSETDGLEVDDSEVDDPEVDDLEGDGPEVDDPEADVAVAGANVLGWGAFEVVDVQDPNASVLADESEADVQDQYDLVAYAEVVLVMETQSLCEVRAPFEVGTVRGRRC